ncbi:hypothetical protein, partial [Xenorhabdus hominickii]|uniref:hypothetical protein n=1 Tax=Xenorhabdus hominickii TaxID=351679 RepID=UPI001B7FFD20
FVTITAIDVSFGHALPLKGGKHITTTNYLIHDQYYYPHPPTLRSKDNIQFFGLLTSDITY